MFLLDISLGWAGVQTIVKRYPTVFLHCDTSSIACNVRRESNYGLSEAVLTKLIRLSGVTFFDIDYSKSLAGSEDLKDIKLTKRLMLNNYFDEQVWGFITLDKEPLSEEEDLNTGLKKDKFRNLVQQYPYLLNINLALSHNSKGPFFAQRWEDKKPVYPILNTSTDPEILGEFVTQVLKVNDCIISFAGSDVEKYLNIF